MVSRRRLLAGLGGGAVGLAGCSSRTPTESSEVPERRRDRTPEPGSERSPTTVSVRNPGGDAVLASLDRRPPDVLADDDWPGDGAFAPGVPDARIDAVESFVEATEFDSESIYSLHYRPASCDRFVVRSVTWKATEVEVDACTVLRPPDERCEARTRAPILTLVRIPAPLDPDSVNSFGGSFGPCRDRHPDYENVDANATEVAE